MGNRPTPWLLGSEEENSLAIKIVMLHKRPCLCLKQRPRRPKASMDSYEKSQDPMSLYLCSEERKWSTADGKTHFREHYVDQLESNCLQFKFLETNHKLRLTLKCECTILSIFILVHQSHHISIIQFYMYWGLLSLTMVAMFPSMQRLSYSGLWSHT